jgi:hypothetical protein
MFSRIRPRIGLLLRREQRKNQYVNFVSEYHLQLLLDNGAIPIPIPICRLTVDRLPYYREK